MRKSVHACVIGAGACGLTAAATLREYGIRVTVFEENHWVGGVWKYDSRTDADAGGRGVHSSMYKGLRTNLPREVMGYVGFPFTADNTAYESEDERRFPLHAEVQKYLEAYAREHGLTRESGVLRTGCRVLRAEPTTRPLSSASSSSSSLGGAGNNGNGNALHDDNDERPPSPTSTLPQTRWTVHIEVQDEAALSASASASASAAAATGEGAGETRLEELHFDAIVCCNGHYRIPNYPEVEGLYDTFKGIVMHSHDYREPSRFEGMRVVVVGHANSGDDISREIAEVADAVFVCAHRSEAEMSTLDTAYGPRANIYKTRMLRKLDAESTGHTDGDMDITKASKPIVMEKIDAVVICTGYKYDFPFLSSDVVGVDDSRVLDVYRHIFLPSHLSPSLSFVGLPWKVIPLPLAQMQAHYIAQLLLGVLALPDPDAMRAELEKYYSRLDELVGAKSRRYTHRFDMSVGNGQFEYSNTLAKTCGLENVTRFEKGAWMQQLYEAASAARRGVSGRSGSYRDNDVAFEDINALVEDAMRTERPPKIPAARIAASEVS